MYDSQATQQLDARIQNVEMSLNVLESIQSQFRVGAVRFMMLRG